MPNEGKVREAGAKLRLPPIDIDTEDPIVQPIFAVLKQGGSGPLHIHRAMAHAPAVYRGFSVFAHALREPGATSRADRELVILRTAQLKASIYELVQHERIGLSVGLTRRQIDSLSAWPESDAYDARQRLLLELTDAMVLHGGFTSAQVALAEEHFSAQELVELVMVSAFYVAVAQFTHSVDIVPETVATTYGED